MSRVGIIGSGAAGRALGLGFVSRGHEVMIGSREPGQEELQHWVAQAEGRGSTGTDAQAAEFAEELAVFAVRWSGAATAAALTGAENLAGKIVIDVTNPVIAVGDGGLGLAVGCSDSAGEQVQRWFPRARVVKCFNIIAASHMVDPVWLEGQGHMFLCGNDAEARDAVRAIAEDFNFHCVDLGGMYQARLIEPMAILRMEAGRITDEWDVAFRLAKVAS